MSEGNGAPPNIPADAWWKFRRARCWSNAELRTVAPLFGGHVANVSGYRDEDKEGGFYRDYFRNASAYTLTNFEHGAKGFMEGAGEIFLDLSAELPEHLAQSVDVAFSHTVLEHVFDCRRAFRNICLFAKDVVICVVPYIQQLHHGDSYCDYWRFTPFAMRRMYEENGLMLRYTSANGADPGSVYLFCVGYRDKRWDEFLPERFDLFVEPSLGNTTSNVIGSRVCRGEGER